MKLLSELQLPASIHDALQAVRDRITTEFRVDRLVFFGSLVRGESDAESDADLLIVLTERPTHEMRDHITGLVLDINLEYGTNLSELIVDRQTWDDGLSSALPVHQEIEEKGIRL